VTPEKRGTVRTVVEIDAELRLEAGNLLPGRITNISGTGASFTPVRPAFVAEGYRGLLAVPLPAATTCCRLKCEIKHVTNYHVGARQGQGIGLGFIEIADLDERAIIGTCYRWDEYCNRATPVRARCFVRGLGERFGFSGYATADFASRAEIRLRFSDEVPLETGASVEVKLRHRIVACVVRRIQRMTHGGTGVWLTYDGWGRDFLLHEMRHSGLRLLLGEESASDVKAVPDVENPMSQELAL